MAERIEGLSIGLDLETMKIDSGLKNVNTKLKLVNSEMKANMSAFDRSDKSIGKYETRLTGLNKKLEVQKEVTEKALKSYEKMVKEHGEGSEQAEKAATEYNNQAAALNNLERYVEGVKDDLAKLKEEQRIANSNWTKFGNKLDETGSKMKTFGDNAKGVGSIMSTGVTAPILGFGTAIGIVASNVESSSVRMQNSLGLTSKEAKELTRISRNIYKKGFGESTEEIENALIQTRQNIKDLNNEDLERITQKAFTLADTFETDVNEVTRAGNNLMKGFGIEADQAFDLMAHGAQNGLNFSNEMFDNLSEYSTLFASMGYSAEEYFQLLQKGTEAGVYNLDYINDVMKEFQIRVKDGSDATSDAMSLLSKDTQKVWKEFLKGDKTVKDVSNTVLSELEGMDDQVKANEVGVQLYGTKWEDLETEAMYALGGIDGELKNVDGTMDDMTKNAEKSISQQWKSTWREAKEAVLPLGETLLDFSREVLPDVKEGIQDVTDWFSSLDEQGKKNILMFAGTAAAAGPVITVFGHLATGTGALMQVAGKLTKTIGIAGGKGTAGALSLLGKGGVAGLAVTGIAAVGFGVFKLIEKSKEAKEVNLDLAQSFTDQAVELENSANTFDKLSSKAKLSNAQLAELNDLNIRISESSNPGEIAELQKQYDALAKNSGLSKDELKRLFEANKHIIDQSEEVEKTVSDQGNAWAANTDAVNELVESLYKASRAEIEGERIKQLQQEKELRKELVGQQKVYNFHNKELEEMIKLQNISRDEALERQWEINEALQKETTSEERKKELRAEHNAIDQKLSGNLKKRIADQTEEVKNARISKEETEKKLQKFEAMDLQMANLMLKQAGINAEGEKGLAQLDKSIAKNNEEIAKLEVKRQKNGQLTAEEQKRYDKLVATNQKQQEAKTYINEELNLYKSVNSLLEGKLGKLSKEKQKKIENLAKTTEIKVEEGNIVRQLQKKNDEHLKERKNLVENLKKQGANKDEINKQISALDRKILKNDDVLVKILKEAGLWDQVKDEINLGENALRSQGAQIDKNNRKTDAGIKKEEKRTREAGKDANKDVHVDDNGGVSKLNRDVSQKKKKNVDVSWRQTFSIASLVPSVVSVGVKWIGNALGFAKGTDSSPKGPAFLGEEGPELVRYKNKWSIADFGLYNMPRGAQVFTNEETKKILTSTSSIPGFASGVSPAGEADRIVANLRNTEFMKLLALTSKVSAPVQSSKQVQENGSKLIVEKLEQQVAETKEIVSLLAQILLKDSDVYMDSRLVGGMVEPRVTEIQKRNQERGERFA
ncbi:hypothetical protein BME96_09015 [Virgibacillus halodenitrificans]|uniref:Phage tail tape measure protein domain-containing protein n=1 Tax=Virgibacillus halodenitrificans TaxID=1482 RepID=A0AAC9IZE6_VIRHA|nr:phage tail tape measure protein [Virgibacillus halodenitrificans]APC48298.1 hypothetical protein BME96_09015 [Virgibacillus halodenitrificans]